MIEDLHEVLNVGKDGPIDLEQGQVLIETGFGKTLVQIAINADMFQDLLLRSIVQNYISFRLVEQTPFKSVDTNVQDNEEITTLYDQTLGIRPKLIVLIRIYFQKKGIVQSLVFPDWLGY
ncbi:hypothetical protein B9Z19DRAFT_1125751 [Tuber borchii]|uniref:Uncharacterized protein n=1 Tax=Tuber borchii TaxID=42251 RepID=A0A2T6ZU59_TUBBO|nr:hypothetical protein B9Z19DRAFT_1125751 [Tuber borchii]